MSVHPGSIFIDNNVAGLPQGLWIAVNSVRMVGENSNYDALMAFLQQQRIPLQTVTIAFLPDGTYQ